jgi:nondiscriminating glutamyl-tRNA synthetase
MNSKIRCRMAPSPTGFLHIGTAHTALFNWLFARHHQGTFILRIDDTDTDRNQAGAIDNILDGLNWLGLTWDEGPDIGGPFAPYRQSERTLIYRRYTERLFAADDAYHCYCTPQELEVERKKQQDEGKVPRYSGRCAHLTPSQRQKFASEGRQPAIRFRNSGETVTFTDMVRGKITVDMSQFGDFIIVRSNGLPLLNFAVVVDDIEMKITHVIRGEDFLNATPFQLLMYKALGADLPQIANLSFIYAADHTKLSKRHGATSIAEFRDLGYLPEALVNFLALLGWNPGDDREVFTKDELVSEFTIERVQKGAPVFNLTKLNWFNSLYIRKTPDETLAALLKPLAPVPAKPDQLVRIVPLIKERIERLSDFSGLCRFFWERPKMEKTMFKANAVDHLEKAANVLTKIDDWKLATINAALQPLPTASGWKIGDFFMTLRLAISGSKVTPPLSESLEILGKPETISRFKSAQAVLLS